ncbi:MAG TPA: hypothetical protein VD815_08560 [Candidatus Saccharimonadales bacterium]|nr:hypothetical protein [Candidatus Saccharimonadales bacterium]
MIIKQKNAKEILICGLFVALMAGLTFAMIQIVVENGNKVLAQQKEGQQSNQTSSVPHNAKGHESHQVIVFQNSSDGISYSGTVTFNLSKPADIISFEEVTTAAEPTNATKMIWEVGDKKFVPKTLLKNTTSGSVNFNGSGILAHSTVSDVYTGAFVLNDTTTSNP